MAVLTDRDIRARLARGDLGIDPFADGEARPGVVSYGLSGMGYDVRLSFTVLTFSPAAAGVVDPKAFDRDLMTPAVASRHIIPAHGFALGDTVEALRIPPDCVGLVCDKSTYRRCGLVLGCTVLEPGWEGTVTLELTNATPNPLAVYAGEGIAQVLFFRADAACAVTYAARGGRYMGQRGVTLPWVP